MIWWIVAYIVIGLLLSGGFAYVMKDEPSTEETEMGCALYLICVFWPFYLSYGLIVFISKRIRRFLEWIRG